MKNWHLKRWPLAKAPKSLPSSGFSDRSSRCSSLTVPGHAWSLQPLPAHLSSPSSHLPVLQFSVQITVLLPSPFQFLLNSDLE